MSGRNAKKPAASEGGNDSAADLLRKYSALMREAGSPNGAWNPEPDEHILGMVRADVSLSVNEVKAIFGVKAHCLRNNPVKGRTAWGWTQTGQPFRTTELAAYFGWDDKNVAKWLKRTLDYCFIRKNEEGQLGIGAWVRGTVSPEDDPDPASEGDLPICTDGLPRYLAEAIANKYGPQERAAFINGWKLIKIAARNALSAEKQRIYDREQNELSEYCKAFDPELPPLKRKARSAEADDSGQPGGDPSVQMGNSDSVQNGGGPLYKTPNGSVRMGYIRNQSKAVSYAEKTSKNPSSSSSPEAAERTTTRTDCSVESPEPEKELTALYQAVLPCGTPSRDWLRKLLSTARQREEAATIEEIVSIAQQTAQVVVSKRDSIRDPLGYLFAAVVNAFPMMRGATAPPAPEVKPPPPSEETVKMILEHCNPKGKPRPENWRGMLSLLEAARDGTKLSDKVREKALALIAEIEAASDSGKAKTAGAP